jgi:Mrp family chromosome partitioning ATPase
MSRIYEALQQAQRERKGLGRPDLPLLEPPTIARAAADYPGLDMEREMVGLYQSIVFLLPDITNHVIQFLGSLPGEGTSTIVREFSKALTRGLNKTVLLLDTDRKSPNQQLAFNVKPRYGWEDVLEDRETIEKAIYQIGNSSLFLCPVSPHAAIDANISGSPKMGELLRGLRERYDLILVDCPPVATSSDGLAICRRTDGVVMVLGAEETRWPVADRTKDQIIKAGGNILGLILNKRRHHIPNFLYKQLGF